MSSFIHQLQELAFNRDTSVVELLQRTLVASTRLDQGKTKTWAQAELNGYVTLEDIPTYRHLVGRVFVQDPIVGGAHEVRFESAHEEKLFSTMKFNMPIAEIASLANGHSRPEAEIGVSFTPEIEAMIRKSLFNDAKPFLKYGRFQFHAVLESVRQLVLNWSIELETAGVTGEGMSFTDSEAEAAKSKETQITNHFHSTVTNSQLQIGNTESFQIIENISGIDSKALSDLVKRISEAAQGIDLDKSASDLLKSDIATLAAQASSPKPKPGIVRESLASVRTIFEAASGNLLATGLAVEIGRLLG